jgi:hypothetical protein
LAGRILIRSVSLGEKFEDVILRPKACYCLSKSPILSRAAIRRWVVGRSRIKNPFRSNLLVFVELQGGGFLYYNRDKVRGKSRIPHPVWQMEMSQTHAEQSIPGLGGQRCAPFLMPSDFAFQPASQP